jgi:hypothetical protein
MTTNVKLAALAAALAFAGTAAWAKIPPPPPPTDAQKAAAEEKKEKDKAASEKAKAELAASEERAIKNYHANMKKAGKPIPKPVPVAAATPPQLMPPPAGGKAPPTPGGNPASTGAVNAKGHEKGAMTPQGNTPPKGNEMPADAKKKS